jgi:hypothetical protein
MTSIIKFLITLSILHGHFVLILYLPHHVMSSVSGVLYPGFIHHFSHVVGAER